MAVDNAALPGTEVERDSLQIGMCDECGDDGLVLDPTLLQHFRLRVCVTCKQDGTLRDGRFELVSKSRGKEDYALPDSFFHGLAFLAKVNPRHESFAPLKLYLRRTLLEEATRLYGDHDGLEREKQKRRKSAYTKAARRTNHLLKRSHLALIGKTSSDEEEEDDEETKAAKKKRAAAKAYVPVADRDHKHAFAEEVYDEDAKSWSKECACGMKVLFEKL